MMGRLRALFARTPRQWLRCPADGEVYLAPTADSTHDYDVDGVACGVTGVPVDVKGGH